MKCTLDIQLKYEADICVVGAGPAGIAAAVTAARRGANTLLLDAHTFPGGMSTAAMVPIFMDVSDGVNFLPGGFGAEIIDALDARENRRIPSERLKAIYSETLERAGVKMLYYCRLFHAECGDGQISHAFFAGPGGAFAVKAGQFVDATGDGTLAVFAGEKYDVGDAVSGETMPATLCAAWSGIDFDAYTRSGLCSHNDDKMLRLLHEAFANGEISKEDYHHTGFFREGQTYAQSNIGHVFNINSVDEASLSAGYAESLKQLEEYKTFYHRHIPGFENAEIVASASLLGIRESRRIHGKYTLCEDDYYSRRNFPDEIGRYNFPIDIHPNGLGLEAILKHKEQFASSRLGKGESYGIPFRCLQPETIDNLLLCGRCISCDRKVFSSVRVIPACYITGQAAGMAAAISAEKHIMPSQISTDYLRSELRDAGAFFH